MYIGTRIILYTKWYVSGGDLLVEHSPPAFLATAVLFNFVDVFATTTDPTVCVPNDNFVVATGSTELAMATVGTTVAGGILGFFTADCCDVKNAKRLCRTSWFSSSGVVDAAIVAPGFRSSAVNGPRPSCETSSVVDRLPSAAAAGYDFRITAATMAFL